MGCYSPPYLRSCPHFLTIYNRGHIKDSIDLPFPTVHEWGQYPTCIKLRLKEPEPCGCAPGGFRLSIREVCFQDKGLRTRESQVGILDLYAPQRPNNNKGARVPNVPCLIRGAQNKKGKKVLLRYLNLEP